MGMRNLLLFAVGVFGLSGCGVPTYQPGPVPSGAPVSRVAPGAPTFINPGTTAGYGITANLGGAYRLVWTGDAAASGTYRNFQGSVYTPGNFLSIIGGCGDGSCPLESGDFVSTPLSVPGGSRIDFDTTATTGLDGFDFEVDLEPVYFDLLIDGARVPQLVLFEDGTTFSQAFAPSLPFGLTTN